MEQQIVKVENGKIQVLSEVTKQIADFKKAELEIKLLKDELTEQLKEAMEKYGIKTFEDDNIKVIHKEGTTRTTVDSKRLKAELPDIYEEYSKTSNVASSLTIEAK